VTQLLLTTQQPDRMPCRHEVCIVQTRSSRSSSSSGGNRCVSIARHTQMLSSIVTSATEERYTQHMPVLSPKHSILCHAGSCCTSPLNYAEQVTWQQLGDRAAAPLTCMYLSVLRASLCSLVWHTTCVTAPLQLSDTRQPAQQQQQQQQQQSARQTHRHITTTANSQQEDRSHTALLCLFSFSIHCSSTAQAMSKASCHENH
jgi:hypothetical protein